MVARRPLYRTAERWQQARWGLLLGASVAALLLLFWGAGLFQTTRLRFTNLYYLPKDTSQKVVIVALDNASLDAYGRSPVEWPRDLYAELVEIANRGGARVIAFDLLFAEPTAQDQTLVEAIETARYDSPTRTRTIMPIVGLTRATNADLLSYQASLPPESAFRDVVDYLGYINSLPAVDGSIRSQPSLVWDGTTQQLSFSLAVLMAHSGIPASAAPQLLVREGDTLYITPDLTPNRKLQLDEQGLWKQNYYGGPEQSFDQVSFVDVIEGNIAPEFFKDKIVLVGLMSASGLTDLAPTPLGLEGQEMAGVEVQANAVETLLNNASLHEPRRTTQALLIMLVALAVSLLYTQMRWGWMLISAGLFMAVLWVGAFVLFDVQRLMLALFDLSLAVALPAFLTLGLSITLETQRRRITEQQNALLNAVLAGSPGGILVLDRAGTVLMSNPATQADLGVEGKTFVGLPVTELLKAADVSEEEQQKIMGGLEAGNAFRLEQKIAGHTLTLQAAPLPDKWVLMLHDVSALSELSELKTQMIRMASHDLKNPLSIIMGYVTLLEDEQLPAEAQNYITRINTASHEMLTIITEILSLEQLRAGQLNRTPLDLKELVGEIIKRHQPELKQKNQTFNSTLTTSQLPIIGDRVRLIQALSNLLGNAIKYTPEKGHIQVRVSNGGKKARFEVEDTGYGIPKDSQSRLFTQFYRVRTASTAHIAGTGLGLSLVKEIIEAHGGKIGFQSEEGVGSTFFVELPLET